MTEPDRMITPQSKLPGVGTTIFAVISQLAADHGALNLGQGFPDFDGPPALRDRVAHYMNSGHNQYAPMPGVPALRQAIAGKVATLYGRDTDADSEVTVTPGATEALFCAINALVRPGDEVIVFDPAYDSYDPATVLAGGICRHLPLKPSDYRPDWAAVRDAITDRTRLIVLNSPHNPTGAILTADDLDELEAVLDGTDIFVLSDEVYEHIVFSDEGHQSILRRPALARRGVAVSSFGKTYHCTGWKVGYAIAPPAIMAEIRKVHQYVTFAVNTPVQMALADIMTTQPEHHLELPAFYRTKRDRFRAEVAESRFRLLPCAGTYFQLLDYSDIADISDGDMARRLIEDHGIATVPISVFYESPPEARLLRACFAKDDATLARAGEILRAV